MTTDGEDLAGGRGLQALLETLHRTRLLGVAVRRLYAVVLLDRLDESLKQHRGALGRFVPDVTGPRRYP